MNDRIYKYSTKPCSECGGTSWKVHGTPHAYMVIDNSVNPPMNKGNEALLVDIVICGNCGFTKSFLSDDGFKKLKND
ncbi:hypothetical protein J3A84_04820 [Proteiniclasticum sp. SCR006]|uniref:Uncharacterized protein n=1 Tax=Proteiniclasticum aestuarii TaxID=2817862 RepID=A0A939H9C6_9CLOT|nr:hypothetical protein [Proteiniclasticum aestuarii]MBO1264363.1 hypothetical protein [Proteiniclasticum aestuarii]